ncbi:hypothetical protein [Sphingobacterium cellulitidis]|uniref:hypothetical protein n=1 Tax=Sphingobacterium cellulitidis TaxID=1768011 RepID=UPI00146B9A27
MGSISSLFETGESFPDARRPNWNDGGSHPLKSMSSTKSNSTVKSIPKEFSLSVKDTLF